VVGVFYDSEPLLRQLIEIEMNSANDNPIIDPETENIFHGGHFYGGHICLAMDTLKNIVANFADLLDRQLATIVDIKFNRNLPPNLSGSQGEFSLNHGFKAVQIGVSSWTAEALHNTMPMSVFSRSTECHNQDKVSMGTIAARDCIRVIELTEQVAAAVLLAASQALRIRLERGEIFDVRIAGVRATYDQVFEHFAPLACDRQLEGDLRKTLQLIREKHYAV
jgi:histidine ammonia-lyase